MPDLYLVVDLIVVVALSVLGLTVLLKSRTVLLNRTFAYFVGCISVWIIANYVSNDLNNVARTAVIANYFVFSFSFGAAVFLLRFVSILANDTKTQHWLHIARWPLLAVGIMSATPLVVSSVTVQDKVYAVNFGPLSPLYFVTLIGIIGVVVFVTYRRSRTAVGAQRERLRVLFNSLCWTFPALILAQAVLPATTGWFGLTNVGVLPMLILVYGLYYGVVKHRLFELRLVIVRAFAYIVTLGTIATIYGVISYYITTLIAQAHSARLAGFLNTILIVAVVVIYPPTKRLFDRLTNKFFYQDAYDPQDLIDELNRLLVSSLDVKYLMMHSSEIISRHVKAEYCMIGLRDGDTGYRMFGTRSQAYADKEVALVRKLTPRIHQNVIVVDDLDADRHVELQDVLRKNGVAVLVRLTANVHKTHEGLGYIILGGKQSGSAYTTQDRRVLDTLANELIIAIQNALHFEEIQKFNITLQEKVDDATRRLRESNRKLKKLNDSKDDFIGMASHQLRTPLTSAKGYISLVLDGDAGKINKDQKNLLEQAFASSQRMVYLIADLLNVSRLKTGKFVIERSPTELPSLVSGELAQLKTAAAAHNITLSFTEPKDFPSLELDETKTRQVVMNFLDNAIYYTPNGGNIRVELRELPKTVEFEVHDDGIGVPKDEQHNLFTKFYRAKNAQRARPDGTGLGLYMARKVVVAQGGSIIFNSKEGEGSTFGFSFPKIATDEVSVE